MSYSNGFSAAERANPRPIELHRSALTNEEYDYFSSILSELSMRSMSLPSTTTAIDTSLESATITLREARAWLRGRFHSVSPTMVDEILRLFPAPLTGDKELTGAQFFAALRLMFHVQIGMKELDSALVFSPATITSESSSETADVKKGANNQNDKSSKTANAFPNNTSATVKPPITIKAPFRKFIPLKRGIDVESEDNEDDEDMDGDKTTGKGFKQTPFKSAPALQKQLSKSQTASSKPPAQKARRTNAGKRKSDATWEETPPKRTGMGTQKASPASFQVPANKVKATSPNETLTRQTIKKLEQHVAPAPVPMPQNTRIIRPAIIPAKWQGEKTEHREEEDEASFGSELAYPESEEEHGAKSKPFSRSKSMEKLPSDEYDSDADPNKTKSDISDVDQDLRNKNKSETQSRITIPSPPPFATPHTKKLTARKTTSSKSKIKTTPKAAAKGKQVAPDGFLRPPPTKNGQYTVSGITASRTSPTGAVELRVIWKGYPDSESTWEPLASVERTDAYGRWMAMWKRLDKKGIRDVQIVQNRKKTLKVDEKMREHKLVQEVGTRANEGTWFPTKEAEGIIARMGRAVLEDKKRFPDRA